MASKVLEDVLSTCKACIIACEHCIKSADTCEQKQASDRTCQEYIARANECCETAMIAVKACNRLITELTKEGHSAQLEVLNSCVKTLDEHNRILQGSVISCERDADCKKACISSKQACKNAIQALGECVTACESSVTHE